MTPSIVLLLSTVAASVQAQTEAPSPLAAPVPAPQHHQYQLGFGFLPGFGYRLIFPWEDDIVCGDSSSDASRRVCTNAVPLFLDFQLSYGVHRRIDLLADVRFGLAGDSVGGSRAFAIAPGIRIWIDQDESLKFFSTVQLVYDSTDYHGVVSKTDFGFRNSNGVMYDVMRNVGFYLQFGETLGTRRWLRIEIDVGFGVQVRFN
jgi:hypothetical protein